MIKLSETEARSVRQASPAQLSYMVDNARVALGARELKVALPTPELTAILHTDDEIIVQVKKEKSRILQEYEKNFGANYSDSIITKKKGKHYYIDTD